MAYHVLRLLAEVVIRCLGAFGGLSISSITQKSIKSYFIEHSATATLCETFLGVVVMERMAGSVQSDGTGLHRHTLKPVEWVAPSYVCSDVATSATPSTASGKTGNEIVDVGHPYLKLKVGAHRAWQSRLLVICTYLVATLRQTQVFNCVGEK